MAVRKKIPLIPTDSALTIAAAKTLSTSVNLDVSGADVAVVGSGTAVITFPATTGTLAKLTDITGTNSGTNTGDNSANTTYTIGSQTQAYNANLTGINQALTTTSSPSFTTVTAALTGTASGNLTSANIEDSVTDGHTTIAPSGNAVFDALALKAPLASPVFTTQVTIPVALTGVVRADSGVLSIDSDVTDIVAAASTSAAGKAPQATAPAAGLTNVVAIENGETVYKNKALFSTTHPSDLGTAAEGSGATAARIDHVHNSQVEDSVTDAHTTIAPSGNAVFDALVLKSPLSAPVFTTSIQTPTVELGHATDSTITRISAGVLAIEGNNIITTNTLPAVVNPTIQNFTSSTGTYTTPAGVTYIKVRMVGAGGGGAGSGTGAGAAAGDGGNSTFGTTLLVANGGVKGVAAAAGGAGGSASLGAAIGIALAGGAGDCAMTTSNGGIIGTGGRGGSSPLGGAGAAPNLVTAGNAAVANSGSGGSGGSPGNSAGQQYGGSGGGAGGYVDAIIVAPGASYAYAVGAGGGAGGAGAGGHAGGAGGAGVIIIEEHYGA